MGRSDAPSTSTKKIYSTAHQQAQQTESGKRRRDTAPNVLAKSTVKKEQVQSNEPDAEGIGIAICQLVPMPELVKGHPRCLIVYSQPARKKKAPRLAGIRNVAYLFGLSSKSHIEPFRRGYTPTHEQDLLTKRIIHMFKVQGLGDKFQCPKFTYACTQGAIAIGFAIGRPARTQNTLLANFLPFTEKGHRSF